MLPCEVASDSTLSPVFKWFFNGKAIDFSRQDHFEMIGGVGTCVMQFMANIEFVLYLRQTDTGLR